MRIESRMDEVIDLVRWFVNQDVYLCRLAMLVDSVDAVISLVVIDSLNRRLPEDPDCSFSTQICNQCRWSLYRAWTLRKRCITTATDVAQLQHPYFVAKDIAAVEDDPAEVTELSDAIERALISLTYREREIIKLRYGLGDGCTYTLEEVGRIFRVTRERVRQVENKALKKLSSTRISLSRFVPTSANHIEATETTNA